MKRPEILSPAGNFEKMRAAILYGADAVYLAGQIFGMRAAADNFSLAELAEDVQAYVYACCMNKVCAVCRRKAELHHVDRVGMGRNRDDICHTGMEALPLCRDHHMEAHQHGDARLMDKYHLEPITIDEKIARHYKLGKKKEADE